MAAEPIAFLRAGARPAARTDFRGGSADAPHPEIRFERHELDGILRVYGRMVAAGEWRDYAIDFLFDRAVFSIYRNSAGIALYRIEKRPKLRSEQGQYSVIEATGRVLKRGHELKQVLRVFDRKLLRALAAE
ncbi:MAG TPA: DUF2794 domain-containing protein [Rhizomicrobium sp.]|jgi:hypothetical protein